MRYTLFGQTVTFTASTERWLDMWVMRSNAIDSAVTEFLTWYKDKGGIKDVLDGYEAEAGSLISRYIARPLYDELASKYEIFDISKETYADKCIDLDSIYTAFNKIAEKYNAINSERDTAIQYRAARKDSRGRWEGGGFGVSGAIKGAATAGAMNLASGAAHSAFNAVGNLASGIKASSQKGALYRDENTLLVLGRGISNAIYDVTVAHIKLINSIKNDYFSNPFDTDKATALLENAKKIPDKREDLLVQSFSLCPWNEDLMKYIFIDCPDERKNIWILSKRCRIDLTKYVEEIISREYTPEASSSELLAITAKKKILKIMEEYHVTESKTLDKLESDGVNRLCMGYEEKNRSQCLTLMQQLQSYDAQDKFKQPYFEGIQKRIYSLDKDYLDSLCVDCESADKAQCLSLIDSVKEYDTPEEIKQPYIEQIKAALNVADECRKAMESDIFQMDMKRLDELLAKLDDASMNASERSNIVNLIQKQVILYQKYEGRRNSICAAYENRSADQFLQIWQQTEMRKPHNYQKQVYIRGKVSVTDNIFWPMNKFKGFLAYGEKIIIFRHGIWWSGLLDDNIVYFDNLYGMFSKEVNIKPIENRGGKIVFSLINGNSKTLKVDREFASVLTEALNDYLPLMTHIDNLEKQRLNALENQKLDWRRGKIAELIDAEIEPPEVTMPAEIAQAKNVSGFGESTSKHSTPGQEVYSSQPKATGVKYFPIPSPDDLQAAITKFGLDELANISDIDIDNFRQKNGRYRRSDLPCEKNPLSDKEKGIVLIQVGEYGILFTNRAMWCVSWNLTIHKNTLELCPISHTATMVPVSADLDSTKWNISVYAIASLSQGTDIIHLCDIITNCSLPVANGILQLRDFIAGNIESNTIDALDPIVVKPAVPETAVPTPTVPESIAPDQDSSIAEPTSVLTSSSFRNENDLNAEIKALINRYGKPSLYKYFLPCEVSFSKKINNAKKAYANLFPGEIPLLLCDQTLFGSAKEGFVISNQRIIAKTTYGEQCSLSLQQIDSVSVDTKGNNIYLCINAGPYKINTGTFNSEEEIKLVQLFWRDVIKLLTGKDIALN